MPMTGIPRDPLDTSFLSSLRSRDARDRAGLFLAEGVRFLVRAADARAPIVGIVTCDELLRNPLAQMVLRRQKAAGTPVRAVSAGEFNALSRASEPQGVLLLLRQRWDPLPDPASQRCATWVAVEQVRIPMVGDVDSLNVAVATGVLLYEVLSRRLP